MNEQKENFNLKEMAEFLNCSPSMIRKLIYNNEIPYYKIGNRYYSNRIMLSTWLAKKYQNGMKEDIENV